ncbi:MAG TPA: hypothetical protein PKW57_06575 [Anaerolineaceae bacterium]|jgi:hypothetical protein|nr:hypothetical protein [Anaerolineaceae bacterium]
MLKKGLVLVLSIALLLAATTAVSASAPVITVYPLGPLYYTSFPQTVNVAFNVTHDPNVDSVSNFSLYVNDDLEVGPTDFDNVGNLTSYDYSLPWTITAPGTYTLKIQAKHGNAWGEDTETVEVYLQVIVDYPAAPAVAAKLLKTHGFTGKNMGSWVSQVALHMGPETDFDGVQKSEVAAYEAAVDAFLRGLGAY